MALSLHDDGGVLAGQKQSGVVDSGDEVEVLLLEGSDGAGTDDTGVGYHDIQTAELFHDLRNQIGNALLVGNVDTDGAGALAHLGAPSSISHSSISVSVTINRLLSGLIEI